MDILKKSLQELAGNIVDENEDDNYTKDYVGVVEDNKDPEKIGRCRVRVHGLYDDIPVELLPWASPAFPIPFGVKGSFIVPEVSTVLEIKFDDGDLYEPKYYSKVLDTKNLNFQADKDEDYPDSVILYESKGGDFLKINRFKGEFIVNTASGVMMKFSENGDINLTNRISENGDCKLSLKGNFTIDNRLADTNIITSKFSTSAFSDIDIKTNGGIDVEGLDDVNISTNRDINLISSDRVSIKARSDIKTETLTNKILSNTIELLPSAGLGTTTDVNGFETPILPIFSVAIGNDKLKVPMMYVKPDPLGGPFAAIPFDMMTGLPAQGRIVTGAIVDMTADPEQILEIAKMIVNVEVKYANLLKTTLYNIGMKYTSIDSQAKLIVSSLTTKAGGTNLITEEQNKEIASVTKSINDARQAELDQIESKYSKYLTEPIFGTIKSGQEGKRFDYNVELIAAEALAKLDVTGKTNAKDLVGSGEGIISDDNN